TRDGGAMLSRAVNLYSLTRLRDDRALGYQAAPPARETVRPVDQTEESISPSTQRKSEPHVQVTPRNPAAEWEQRGSADQHGLVQALYAQGYRNIEVSYDGSHRVLITLAHSDLRPIGRAVGRAARTALRHAPLEA